MIKIVLDATILMSSADGLIVERVDQYPAVYAKIQEALQSQQELTIIVHPRSVSQWFKNMCLRFPQGTFAFEMLDARAALGDRNPRESN